MSHLGVPARVWKVSFRQASEWVSHGDVRERDLLLQPSTPVSCPNAGLLLFGRDERVRNFYRVALPRPVCRRLITVPVVERGVYRHLLTLITRSCVLLFATRICGRPAKEFSRGEVDDIPGPREGLSAPLLRTIIICLSIAILPQDHPTRSLFLTTRLNS